MIARRAAAIGAVVALLGTAPSAGAQPQASVDALQQWADAVRKHEPGKPDPAAAHVASWSYAHRVELNPAMERFLAMPRDEGLVSRTPQQEAIAALFRSVGKDPGMPAFLRRASMLHTDAAIFAEDLPEPPDDGPPASLGAAMSAARRQGEEPPPLLSSDRYILHTDGRIVGERSANWNWAFARSVTDHLLVPDRSFVAEWYHAVAAYMLANGRHGDARKHLMHAAMAMPDDPHLLFDRACFAEALGLPFYQVLRDDPSLWSARGMFIAVPPEETTDVEAEGLFRRTLEVDPSYLEARVRLARLLNRRGHHDEASSLITNAIEHSPAGAVAFFAQIVAGRIASAQGRYDASLQHYRDALQVFPQAQSALLGASHAALMIADMPQALAPVEELGPESEIYEADPWRDYQLGAGRDVNDLMARLWIRVSR